MRLPHLLMAIPRCCRRWKAWRRGRNRHTRFKSCWANIMPACFIRAFGIETVALRFFNVYGERQDPSSPYSGVISVFMRALIERRSPTIFGDGEQTRDWTYVEDVAALCVKAASAAGVAGKRYADDSNIYVRSRRAGGTSDGKCNAIHHEATQAFKVNQQKSAVARPWERKFLGFRFTWSREPRKRIAPKAVLRFKERIRELTQGARA